MICYCLKISGGDLMKPELFFDYGLEESVKRRAEYIHTWPKLGAPYKEFAAVTISSKEITKNMSTLEINDWIEECRVKEKEFYDGK